MHFAHANTQTSVYIWSDQRPQNSEQIYKPVNLVTPTRMHFTHSKRIQHERVHRIKLCKHYVQTTLLFGFVRHLKYERTRTQPEKHTPMCSQAFVAHFPNSAEQHEP